MKLSNSFFWIGQSLYSPIYYVMIYKIIYVNNLNKSHNSLKKSKTKVIRRWFIQLLHSELKEDIRRWLIDEKG